VRSRVRSLSGNLLAVGVLLLCAFLLFKVVLGFVTFLAWSVVAVIAVIGVLWALNRVL
jgi:energy-converting hydrogenase Eha subunit E